MLVNKLKYHRLALGLLICVLTGLVSNLALAFKLGDIRLNSSLNEPLSANIELLELDGLNENQILVTLGPDADFDRVGVEPLPLLNELEFEVDVLSASEGVVRISSTDAIVEPYLNFVLNVRWPSGRVIREYTVLLDLPTFSANPTPAPAPTPARSSPTPPPARPLPQVEPESAPPQIAEMQEEAQEVMQVPEPAPTPTINEQPADNSSPETVVIQTGDSMWNIALATRPDNDVSVQQMMLAIQRANAGSDAFIRNNINGIRAGRVLRIPSRQEINAISQEQAITQVAVQNQQFSNNAQPLAINNSQGGSNNARDELSIVNSSNNDEAENAEIADLNATISNLENELAFSEENLDRALLENEELRSRLSDLEEEIAILENIIAIEAQRMAELQESLAEQNNNEVSDVLAVVPPQNTAPAATPAPVVVVPEAAPAPSQGLIANLLSSTLGMLAALVVLLALIVGFLMMRNRKVSYKEDDFDSVLAEEEPSFSANSEEDADIEDAIIADEAADETTEAASEDIEDTENGAEQDDFNQSDFSESEEESLSSENNVVDELADQEIADDDIFSDDDAEIEDEKEPVRAGFLAGLLAKFSRKKLEDSDEDSATEEFFAEEGESEDTLINEESREEAAEEASDETATTFNEDDVVAEEAISEDDFENFLEGIEVDNDTDDAFDADAVNADEADTVDETAAEATDADEGLEEIVFDLDDDDSVDEIEFLDNDDPESSEDIGTKEPSSLGKLGLDDAVALDESDEEELEIITDEDEVSTKLDLAVAYHAMDDIDGAKEILDEVIAEGNDAQIAEAKRLLDEWGAS